MLNFIPKRLLVGGSIFVLCLMALLSGGLFLNSAQASQISTSKTSQSNAFIKGGFHVLQVQGQNIQATIQRANSDSLKQAKAITIHLNASTHYYRGDKMVPSFTITPGSDIAAYGTLNSDGSLTALGIAIGDPTGGDKSGDRCADPQGAMFSGVITAVSGTTLTVVDGMNGYRYNPTCNNLERGAPLTFTVITDASTRFVQGKSTTVSSGAFTVGTQIALEGVRTNSDTVKASQINLISPFEFGKVIAIHGTTITLEGNLTVKTDANTKVVNKAHPNSSGFADLKVGDTIFASGTKGGDGVLTAAFLFYLAS